MDRTLWIVSAAALVTAIIIFDTNVVFRMPDRAH
jgi:hypothetical protein